MGVLRGVDRNGWGESVRVVACETHGANCLAAALDAGELVTLPGITSIAKSLGADRASPTVFDECTKRAAKGALGVVLTRRESTRAGLCHATCATVYRN